MLLPSCTTHECPYPIAHLYTHTFGERHYCTCLLTGGHGAESVTSLIRCVLVGVHRAHNFTSSLTTFLHVGGTRRVVVLLCVVQKCAAYGADVVHFRCSWTGKVNNAEVHTWLLYPTRPLAQPKCNYALSVPLQRWLGGNN